MAAILVAALRRASASASSSFCRTLSIVGASEPREQYFYNERLSLRFETFYNVNVK